MPHWMMRYGDMLERAFPVFSTRDTLGGALGVMLDRRVDVSPVFDEAGDKLLGVARKDDLMRALLNGASDDAGIVLFMDDRPRKVLPEEPVDTDVLSESLLVTREKRLEGIIPPGAAFAALLRAEEMFMEILLSSLPHAALLVDREGMVQECNARAWHLFPARNGDPVGCRLTELLPGFSLETALKGASPEEWREERLLLNNREYASRIKPLWLDERVAGYLLELADQSSLDKLQAELFNARQELLEVSRWMEFSFDGVCVTDEQGTVLLVNAAFERLTSLAREHVVGRNARELVEDRDIDRSVTLQVLKTGKPATLAVRVRDNMKILASGKPLLDATGKIHRVVVAVRDASELEPLSVSPVGAGSSKEEARLEWPAGEGTDSEPLFRSEAMAQIVEQSRRLGSVDSTVLIQGESGVGKEVIADLIHRHSLRRHMPFIKLNCAAIPEQLLESELFGYVRGAFTGASKEGKMGLFEAAQGGTLLLDEVGDLPLALQVKLLRVIQDKELRRVGDTTARSVDVRLLAATHKDLAAMLAEGRFREDLYYRLNVVPVHVPPLRDRKEDILVLTQAFLEAFCQRHNKKKELHSLVLPVLLEYPWPGNVRELENIMERIVVTSPRLLISVRDLPPHLFKSRKRRIPPLPVEGETLKDIMDNFEAKILCHCFTEYKTTREVASALGVHQSNIVRKIQRLGLAGLVGGKDKDGEKDAEGEGNGACQIPQKP